MTEAPPSLGLNNRDDGATTTKGYAMSDLLPKWAPAKPLVHVMIHDVLPAQVERRDEFPGAVYFGDVPLAGSGESDLEQMRTLHAALVKAEELVNDAIAAEVDALSDDEARAMQSWEAS